MANYVHPVPGAQLPFVGAPVAPLAALGANVAQAALPVLHGIPPHHIPHHLLRPVVLFPPIPGVLPIVPSLLGPIDEV